MPSDSERSYIVEFVQVGNVVKATACDPVTTREVSILGPASTPRALLQRNVVRKLEYVIGRDGGPRR